MSIQVINGITITGGMIIKLLSVPPALSVTLPTTALSVVNSGNIVNNIAWYTFDVTATQYIAISTTDSPNNPDTMIALYDAAGNIIGANDEFGGFSTSLFSAVLIPGTYYAAVAEYYSTFDNSFGASALITDIAGPVDTQGILFSVFAAPMPTVSFSASPTSGVLPLTVSFSGVLPVPAAILYDFGDGFVSPDINTMHTYTTPGTYSVTLTAYDGNGLVLSVASAPNLITVTTAYLGTWNPGTNTPGVTNGIGATGTQYIVSVAGTADLGAGPVAYAIGDFIRYDGAVWTLIPAATSAETGATFYSGTFNASTNTPALADGSGVAGSQYIVSVAGTVNLGSGNMTLEVTDYVIYNGTTWEKLGNYAVGMGVPLVVNVTVPVGAIEFAGYTPVPVMINWGDGTVDTCTAYSTPLHSYTTAGSYKITIWHATVASIDSYGFYGFYNPATNYYMNEIITSIETFGNLGFTKLYLQDAVNLVSVPASIPASVTDISFMFFGCSAINDPNISLWDVSNVTNIDGLFYLASAFNQPLNTWNISKATNLGGMFFYATSFNQPLNSWNTSNATSLNGTFLSAVAFNQPLNSWNTSKVTNMFTTFSSAVAFNQDISMWDTSNVTDMTAMFAAAFAFNQDISAWNVATNIPTYPTQFALNSFLDPVVHPENHAKLPQVWATTWPTV